MLFISYANESSPLDENLPARSQFYSDNRVHFSTYHIASPQHLDRTLFAFVFVFVDIKSKRISNRHISCDVYIRSECGSCPADVATGARPRTATHDYGRFCSFINKISVRGSRRFICTGSCSATHGLLLS